MTLSPTPIPAMLNRAALPRRAMGVLALAMLSACGSGLDWDMRGGPGALNTRDAALGASLPPPQAGANGLITYSGYQAVQASGSESVGEIGARLGLDGAELARFNALSITDRPRRGEVLVLPTQVPTATAPAGLDVSAIATTALNRVDTQTIPAAAPAAAPAPAQSAAAEPARHKVQRGETAFGIARQYNVSTRALAEWNGLGPDLGVREGQYLIIPLAGSAPPPAVDTAAPGAGSSTPVPPSASTPLPAEKTIPAAQAKAQAAQPAADLSGNITAASAAALAMPVAGKIIRGYAKGKNDGIDIAAPAGTPVQAAADGSVAAITKSTAGTPIVLIRHSGGILTVYGGVDALTVAKGDTVKRGQSFATVGRGDPSFLHFEVRRGVESVDPMGYLQ